MDRRPAGRIVLAALACLLVATVTASIRFGAIDFPFASIRSALATLLPGGAAPNLDERIFLALRLPRALLCVFVGASLGVGGTLLQGLFRNPIVEPGLVGTSGGAALGAAVYFALGALWHLESGAWALPIAASIGGFAATGAVFLLAPPAREGRGSIVALLLTGMAINALCLSGIGFLSYIARDPQARSITFWNLGTLTGASWRSVAIVGAVTLAGSVASLRFSKALNALVIGEEEALYLGFDIRRLRWIVLAIDVIMVAVATSFTGIIAFVGLIVPHLLRMLRGADHRFLVPASALLGAVLLTLADLIARTVLRPAELPIGIVTSIVGVPVFVSLLRRRRYVF
jgi:iron complex transport system permease protein